MLHLGLPFKLGTLVLVLLLSSSLSAQQKPFDLTSYRPTGYGDLQWPLIGNTEWQGYNSHTDYNLTGYTTRNWQKAANNNRSITLSTQPRYEYQGVDHWTVSSLNVSGYLDDTHFSEKSERINDYPDEQGGRSSYSYDYSRDAGEQSAWLHLSGEYGAYLQNDWFVSLRGAAYYSYYGIPDMLREQRNSTEYHYPTYDWQRTYSRTKSSSYDRYLNLNAELLPGYGRVYDGSFAYTALAIVAELRQSGLLKTEPSHDQLLALTDLIFHRWQTHAVDSRLHRIESLTAILDYLRTEHLTDDLGPAGFAAIADIWDYYPRPSAVAVGAEYHGASDYALYPSSYGIKRQFGWRARAGVGISYSRQSRSVTEDYSQTIANEVDSYEWSGWDKDCHYENIRKPYVTAIIEYHRPLNTHWQFDADAGGRLAFDPSAKDSTTYENLGDSYYGYTDVVTRDYDHSQYASATASLGYFFDGRTSLTGGALCRIGSEKFSYHHTDVPSDTDLEIDDGSVTSDWHQFRLNLNFTYRLQIQTSLQIGFAFESKAGDEYPQLSVNDTNTNQYLLRARVVHNLM